jgi:hypothetical protein
MPRLAHDLWGLVWGTPEIDPGDLARAVEEQAAEEGLDYRTRLLIRDSVEALKGYWGAERVSRWLAASPARDVVQAISREDFERPGFSTIGERLMDKTDPELVRRMFRELARTIHDPLRLAIGGSIALILPGYLSRATDDIDVVNELPKEIRSQHALLDELRRNYGLLLTHFQSHYLPVGWDKRLHYFDTFGSLQVYLVDIYDIFLSKLFSIRRKDMNDLRMLLPHLDKDTLTQRLKDNTADMLAAEELRKRAEQNWYILFGEALPS